MIDLRQVCVRTGAFTLDDVTFTIPSGAFGVVVGAAGAGKTTLLEAIAGVRPLVAGSIVLGGRDVTTQPPEARGVGLVYQRGALFPHKSVMDNVAWSARGGERLVNDVVERLELAAFTGTPVHALSGGERQLVALARALVRVRVGHNEGAPASRVLLLDEPFSALDPRRRLATRETVRALHDEWKLTTLQVTHDGNEARRADVAVLIDAGLIVQSGAPSDMLAAPARDDVPLFLGQ